MFPKVEIPLNKQKSYCTNHLLFIDDLKILTENDSALEIIVAETKRFFNTIELKMNVQKSASNSLILVSEAVLLTNSDCFKYLGIIEDKISKPTKANWELITKKIKIRTEKLCKNNLNIKN